MGASADATGGVAQHVDLGDDLAWRALDLVAALYTPRVTGLTASLETSGGDLNRDIVLAYHVALLRGTDIDQPRNLAKSVTVE